MNLTNKIVDFLNGKHKFKIVNINGDFLTGKTELIRGLVDEREFINSYDFFTYVSDWNKFNYSFDITDEIAKNSNLSEELLNRGELNYFTSSFYDNLSAINLANKEIFNYSLEYLQLTSDSIPDFEFANFIESNIKNELKKTLILKSYEISIEALFADLFNLFYPLKEGMSNISDYLIDNNPKKLLLIYDDLQILNPKIKYWLDLLNTYLTSKKLTDFNIFEIEQEGSELKIGEFFNIDTIIISRNKVYNYDHSDFIYYKFLKNYPKSEYEDFDHFPYKGIDYLIDYKKSNDEIDDTDVIVQAVSEIIKYCPENYQKQLIFSSLFSEFDLLNFNLIDENSLELNSFELLMKDLEFIEHKSNVYRFKDGYKKYFETIAIKLFANFNTSELSKTINSIRNVVSNIDNQEFEVIRRLAYFEKFEKQFVIDYYFNKELNISSVIDKYIFLFDRKSNIYNIKDEYKILFEDYNEIKDQSDYENIIDSVNDLKESYKKEISKRNEILNNEVVNVGEELELLNSELVEMEQKLDINTKEVISKQNELKSIEEKLKPFSNNNSKRKKTANLVALVLSVAIVVNSDRISELFFDTKENFDYVIMIVVLMLLILYGNGLIRYFRTKLQSEELHSLKQERKLAQESNDKLSDKIEVLSADIRAKKAKIEDLRLHIERANNQILENKKKIIYD
ncbi:MAG: hypothetical protein ACE364_02880 [Chlorobiota bacterium]